MTIQEWTEQIKLLSLDERVELLEVLSHSIKEALSANEDDEEIDVHEEFRQAWHEAMSGEEIPLSELLDSLNDE